jgi:hypothetical protein
MQGEENDGIADAKLHPQILEFFPSNLNEQRIQDFCSFHKGNEKIGTVSANSSDRS